MSMYPQPGPPPNQRLADLELRLASAEQLIYRMRRDTFAYRAEAMVRRAGRAPSLPVIFQAQFGEDTALWEIFGGKLDGFFIEVGAYDGEKFSVSFAYEAVGWKGVLIEAIPAAYEKCRALRKNSRVVHAALSKPGHPPTAKFTVSTQIEMLSYLHGDAHHVADIRRRQLPTATVEVPVMTMDEVLKEHTGPIDFVSIDVEGDEVNLLEGFELERFKPRVLMIEDSAMKPDSAVLRYMAAKPYDLIGGVGVNRLYVRRGDEDIYARLKRMEMFLE
ncbi:MAG: FkbM family methyltransferase [Phycisphaerales bacterium]